MSPRGTIGGQGCRPRILLVSYHFPPDQTVGARRWGQLAPLAVERGWGLDVIACAPQGSDGRDVEPPPGVRVFRVPPVQLAFDRLECFAATVHQALRRRATVEVASAAVPLGRDIAGEWRRPDFIDRSEVRWQPYPLRHGLRALWARMEYTRYGQWARRAASLGMTLLERGVHRAVVTSGPPHMTHHAGRAIAERTGLPFVMDMRDPWSLSERVHESIASPVWFWLARRHERAAVEQAALIVANTEAARESLVATYPTAADRLITVMNGSDDDPLPPARRRDRFTIAYAGTIYLKRHPRMLFRAAAAVIRELALAPGDFGIELVGGQASGAAALLELARQEGIEGFVSATPARSHAEVLEFLAGATMLAIFPGWDSITVPAKLFECIRFDAWLLALSEPGSATDRLLQDVPADVVRPGDVKAMAAAMARRVVEFRRGVRPERAVTDDRFSRRRQARILFDAIERLDVRPHGHGRRTEPSARHAAAESSRNPTRTETTPYGARR